jgi:hypothetical protein
MLSCEREPLDNKDKGHKEEDKYVKLVKETAEHVKGIQYKGLGAKNASGLFEEYKVLKLEILKKAAQGKNYAEEQKSLAELLYRFHFLTVEEDFIPDILAGYRENPYIREFEYYFIKTLIKNADSDMLIDAGKLKPIFQNWTFQK